MPGLLLAQQSGSNNEIPSNSPELSTVKAAGEASFKQYFGCLNSCSHFAKPDEEGESSEDAYFDCLNACPYPKIEVLRKEESQLKPDAHLTQVDKLINENCFPTTGMDKTISSRVSANRNKPTIEKCFDALITRRLECYSNTNSVLLRRGCRKEYSHAVMRSAKGYNKSIRATRHFQLKQGHRQLGHFILCVRKCPITIAICKGNLALGRFMFSDYAEAQLRKYGLHRDALNSLSFLKNQRFKDEEEFIEIITQKIGTEVREFILTSSRKQFFRLNEQLLEVLKSQGIPQKISDQLIELKDKKFADKKTFTEAVIQIIGEDTAKQTIGDLPYSELILKHANIQTFHLTDSLLKDLKKDWLPETTVEELSSLKETEFKEEGTFIQEVRLKIESGNQKLILEHPEVHSLQITKQSLDALRKKDVSPAVLEQLDLLKDKKSAQGIFIGKVTQLLQEVQQKTKNKTYMELILEHAKVSFKLSEQVLADMKKNWLPKKSLDTLASLKDKEFSEKDKFMEEVMQKIELGSRELILEHAKVQSFQLTKQSLNTLKKKGVSRTVLEKLELLKDKKFEQAAFIGEVTQLLKEVQQETMELILAHAEVPSFKLTTQSLDTLQEKWLSEKSLETLTSLKNKEFSEKDKFMEEVMQKIELGSRELIFKHTEVQSFQITKQSLDTLRKQGVSQIILKKLNMLEDRKFEQETFQKEIEQILKTVQQETEDAPYMELILAHAEDSFQVTEQILRDLKQEGLPKTTLEKLKSLQSMEFTEKEKFMKALGTQVVGEDTMNQKKWPNMALILRYTEDKCDEKENQCLQQCFDSYYL